MAQMRSTANAFMTTPLTLYSGTLAYNEYGEQTIISGVVWSGLGYFGGLTGADREVLGALERQGVDITYNALVLLPFETPVMYNHIIRNGTYDWRVVWESADTQDSVQVYTKCIVVQDIRQDEKVRE